MRRLRSHKEGTHSKSERIDPEQLHDDLIMRVVAKLPYPNILKARCLSRKWASLFSIDSSHPEAKIFQELVTLESSRWGSFTPILFKAKSLRLLGYDIRENVWANMGTPRMETPLRDALLSSHMLSAGAMVCAIENSEDFLKPRKIVVVNLVTGSFKFLHSPVIHQMLLNGRVFHPVRGGFIIVLLCQRYLWPKLDLVVHTFDSRRGSWDEDTIDVGHLISANRGVVCGRLVADRKLFLLFNNNYRRPSVLAVYDLVGRKWSETELAPSSLPPELELHLGHLHLDRLVACGARVFILCSRQVFWEGVWVHNLFLLEFLESSGTVGLLQPAVHRVGTKKHAYNSQYCSSDEENIYVRCDSKVHQLRGWEVHAYSLKGAVWVKTLVPAGSRQSILWVQNSFSPGLDPFFNPGLLPDASSP